MSTPPSIFKEKKKKIHQTWVFKTLIMKTYNWTFSRNMPKEIKGEMVREGLRTLLEQMRKATQALPWPCVG